MPEIEKEFISALRGYLRLGDFPLDASSVFNSKAEADSYADSNPTAYAGQIIAVVDALANPRTVTIYQLGFKIQGQTGFSVQPLSTSGEGAFVRSINGVLPGPDGNVTITLDKLDEILTFLENTPTRVVFNKPISVPTIQTGVNDGPNDVVTVSYLDARIEADILKGAVRTIEVPFNQTGGSTQQIIPSGSTIKKAVVEITSAFNGTIEILVGNEVIFTALDIFETIVGTYVAEPFIKIPTTQPKYAITINVTGATQGAAKFYLDFNIDFIF